MARETEILIYRTLGAGPPESLSFGELAFSDADNGIHIGKSDGTIHTFQGGGGGGGSTAWEDITGKPTTFAPSAHGHPWSEITEKPTTFAPSAHGHPWSEITEKPTFAEVATSGSYLDLADIPPDTNPVRSISPPSNPADGQEWVQIDANGRRTDFWVWDTGLGVWVGPSLPWPIVNPDTASLTAGNVAARAPVPFPNSRFLFRKFAWNVAFSVNTTGSNFFTVNIQKRNQNTATTIVSVVFNNQVADTEYRGEALVNQILGASGDPIQQFVLSVSKSGSTNTTFFPAHATLECCKIYGS